MFEDTRSVRSTDFEAIVHLNNVVPSRGRGLSVSYLLQQFNLINASLGVVMSRLYYLQSNMTTLSVVRVCVCVCVCVCTCVFE